MRSDPYATSDRSANVKAIVLGGDKAVIRLSSIQTAELHRTRPSRSVARCSYALLLFWSAGCATAGNSSAEAELRTLAADYAHEIIDARGGSSPDSCYKFKYSDSRNSVILHVIPQRVPDGLGRETRCGQGITVLVDRATRRVLAIPMR